MYFLLFVYYLSLYPCKDCSLSISKRSAINNNVYSIQIRFSFSLNVWIISCTLKFHNAYRMAVSFFFNHGHYFQSFVDSKQSL